MQNTKKLRLRRNHKLHRAVRHSGGKEIVEPETSDERNSTGGFSPAPFSLLQPHLDEKTKRLVGAAMADSVGRGDQRMVPEITGLSSPTLKLGHD